MVDAVDVVVIGLGPGGEEVAGRLAEAGLAVVGVEHRLVGGECPYWACVPSKMMIRAANLLAEARRIPGMAGLATVEPDYAPVAARIRDDATDDWDDQVAADRFTGKGGRLVRGTGRLVGPGEVSVDGAVFRARRGVVVATGSQPAVPPVPGLADTPYWTNREAIEATAPPETLVVLGGGAVGCELAQVFARFGSRVHLVEAAQRLLPMEEPAAGDLVADALAHDGVDVHAGATVTSVGHDVDRFELDTSDGPLSAAALLVATGRWVDLAAVGLDSVGIDTTARALAVDEHQRAGDRLWAVGDVTGMGAFTHMAMYQAGVAIRSILERPGPPARYHAVPRVTFTDPEVGAVGLTERQAREAGLRVRVATTSLPASARGWIHQAGNQGFIQLVEDADRGVLVGATSVGPCGGEVLGALAVAVHAAVPTEELGQLIWAYPTFCRAIEAAVAELVASPEP